MNVPESTPLAVEQPAPSQPIQDTQTTFMLELNLLRQVLSNQEEIGCRVRKIEAELQESKRVRTTEVELADLAQDPATLDAIQAIEDIETKRQTVANNPISTRSRGQGVDHTRRDIPLPGLVYDEKSFTKGREARGEPVEDLVQIQIHPTDPTKTTRIGALLSPQQKISFEKFLKENMDVFAWSHDEMPGIDPKVMVHKLNVDPNHKIVQQKRRVFTPEKYEAIREEVDKLLKAGSIQNIDYPTWLANVVLVKKANGQWRLCVDFTDLNKACPKDSFPLPRIDQLVDATAGHELLSFMDAYSGYNQIRMHEPDQEKTAFITDRGLLLQGDAVRPQKRRSHLSEARE